MNIKYIGVDQLPGYDDQHGSHNQMSEETMAILALGEYESMSLPCAKEHTGGGLDEYGRKSYPPEVCKHKQQIMIRMREILNARARKEHGKKWPYPPLWVKCYDKTIYIFRKPWGIDLGKMAHPQLYIQDRDRSLAIQESNARFFETFPTPPRTTPETNLDVARRIIIASARYTEDGEAKG